MRSRTVAVLMILTLTLGLVLSACSSGSNETATTKSTLDTVIEKKVLRVGFLPDFAPWGSRSASGEFEGYDLDIGRKLGEALGVEVEFLPIEAPNRIAALVTGKVDVLFACFTPTDERAKTVNFTIPYASAGIVPMFWADSGMSTYKDLTGKKVAVARGSVTDTAATEYIDGEIIRYDTIADAYAALQTKKVDALIEEDTFVFFQAKQDPRFKAGEYFGSRGLIAAAVAKGDQEWLNYLNNFIRNLRFSGENAALYEKWFGVAPAPLNIE